MLVAVGSVVLVSLGLGLFAWILVRREGAEGLREGLPLFLTLGVALVAAALLVPGLIRDPGTRPFSAAAVAASSSVYAAWMALRARRSADHPVFEVALWTLAIGLALISIASLLLL
jgi:hypothetical protein